MHQTLYRKWRPTDFSSVVGQEHITDILQYEVEKAKTTHAYLFCGSRGTGKTTCAKILAKAVNCLSPVNGNPCGKCEACLAIDSGAATDVLEMDAASNNGVDYIRDIREEVIYAPAMLKKRVYIIDEVHMLSASAFNALLKTLEEPPPQVIFILATTELQKIPATITSRCQRFDFRRISAVDITGRLEFIAAKEQITITHEAARQIARLAQGGMRDAISLLELCSGSGADITVETVNKTAGVAGRGNVIKIAEAVHRRDCDAVFNIVSDFYKSSVDISVFWQDLIGLYRDMLIIKCTKNPGELLDITSDELEKTALVAGMFSRERLIYQIKLLEEAFITMQRGNSIKRICAEMTLVRMCDEKLSETSDALLARISALEDAVSSGAVLARPAEKSADCEKINSPKSTPAEAEKTEKNISVTSPETKLSYIDTWLEVIKKIERSDEGAASMLKLAKAYKDNDKNSVLITVSDSFSMLLFDNDEKKKLIAEAINAAGITAGLTSDKIKIGLIKNESRGEDIFSELDN